MVSFPETYNDPLFFGGGGGGGGDSGGKGALGGGEGGEERLSKFKGAFNLINLNILDKPVKTM